MTKFATKLTRSARGARARSAEYRKLRTELSYYRTESDLADLYAILARYPLEQTAEIRSIVERNQFAAAA